MALWTCACLAQVGSAARDRGAESQVVFFSLFAARACSEGPLFKGGDHGNVDEQPPGWLEEKEYEKVFCTSLPWHLVVAMV